MPRRVSGIQYADEDPCDEEDDEDEDEPPTGLDLFSLTDTDQE